MAAASTQTSTAVASSARMRPMLLRAVWMLHDAVMGAASFVAAIYLRISERGLGLHADKLLYECAGVAVVLVTCLAVARMDRRMWRFVSLHDLLVLARAATFALLLFYVLLFLATRLEDVPRSVVAIHWMCLMLMLAAPRMLWRLLHDRSLLDRLRGSQPMRTPVLLVGAGRGAELFIRSSLSQPDFPYHVVGIISDDTAMRGRTLHHARVYGGITDAAAVIEKLSARQQAPKRLIVTEETTPSEQLVALLAVAESARISLARMPRITALLQGDAKLAEVQPVAVEDILGRAEQQLDRDAMRALIAGKIVLVTGAGGSIGRELCQQIAAFAPRSMVLFELSEFALYSVDISLRETHPDVKVVPLLADVRDAEQLARVMQQHSPQIVFHAAAIKHVPLAEANPEAAVLTNIMGSQHVADACLAHGVELMVQVSTDKAVNPISVMGTTKRVAEMYCQALAQSPRAVQSCTRFVTVRFGNVLNSAGSVVPLFARQIARGGPVTITDAQMTRYFMTISEAVELIVQAAALDVMASNAATQQKQARIYVLEMGKPMRIEELARQMIRLAGRTPGSDIALQYTGLRPGEKLYEELFHPSEAPMPTQHPSIRLARARDAKMETMAEHISTLLEAAKLGDAARIREVLQTLVPEYSPQTDV